MIKKSILLLYTFTFLVSLVSCDKTSSVFDFRDNIESPGLVFEFDEESQSYFVSDFVCQDLNPYIYIPSTHNGYDVTRIKKLPLTQIDNTTILYYYTFIPDTIKFIDVYDIYEENPLRIGAIFTQHTKMPKGWYDWYDQHTSSLSPRIFFGVETVDNPKIKSSQYISTDRVSYFVINNSYTIAFNMGFTKTLAGDGSKNYTITQDDTIFNSPPIANVPAAYYRGERNLIEANFSSNIRFVETFAFYDSYNLQRVNLTDNVQRIDKRAFEGCTRLTDYGESNFPNLEYVGDQAFYGAGINEISFSSKLYYLGKRSFLRSQLESVVIPSSVGVIRESTFAYSKLKTAIVSLGIYHIDQWAFYSCKDLEEIEIPSSVVSIGDEAFVDSFFSHIFIPSSVIKMGKHVFSSLAHNFDIYCEAPSKPDEWNDEWNLGDYPVTWGVSYEDYLNDTRLS